MNNKERIAKTLQGKYPIFVYHPPGVLDKELSLEVIDAGGMALIDTQWHNESEIIGLLQEIKRERGLHAVGIRVLNDKTVKTLASHDLLPPLLVFSYYPSQEIQDQFLPHHVFLREVYDMQSAYKCQCVHGYVLKGFEAQGRVSDYTAYTLLHLFAETNLPFFIQGGMNPFTMHIALFLGAMGVIFETPTYFSMEHEIKKKIEKAFHAQDTRINLIGVTTKKPFRVLYSPKSKALKELLMVERKNLHEPVKKRQKAIKMKLSNLRPNISDNGEVFYPVSQDSIFKQHENELDLRFTNLKQLFEFTRNKGIELIRKLRDLNYELPKFSETYFYCFDDSVQVPVKVIENLLKKNIIPILTEKEVSLKDTKKLMRIKKAYALEKRRIPFLVKTRKSITRILDDETLRHEFQVIGSLDLFDGITLNDGGNLTILVKSPKDFIQGIEKGYQEFFVFPAESNESSSEFTMMTLLESILRTIHNLPLQQQEHVILYLYHYGTVVSSTILSVVKLFYSFLEIKPYTSSSVLMTHEFHAHASNGMEDLVDDILNIDSIKPMVLLARYNEARADGIQDEVMHTSLTKRYDEMRKQQGNMRLQDIVTLHLYPELLTNDSMEGIKYYPQDSLVQYRTYPLHQYSMLILPRGVEEMKEEVKRIESQLTNAKVERAKKGEQPVESIAVKSSSERESMKNRSDMKYEGIAIVGLGAVFPQANNVREYWENILEKKNCIIEVPKDRWDPDIYYDSDKSVPNKTYTKIGGFITDFKFNSLEFRIPPGVADQLDPVQKIALVAAREALQDAGILDNEEIKTRTAVIVGNSMGGEFIVKHGVHVHYEELEKTVQNSSVYRNLNESQQVLLLQELREKYRDKFPRITEDSMPGELSNIIAGRIANVFNLRGKSMTTDAACASSLAALDTAVRSLLDYEFDAVLVGGADRSMDPSTYVKFCKIGALSPDGSFPFDERANGFVMGEGAGFMVLKRLSDAIKDGDRIYAVIQGVGASSDGRGKGITAPNPKGQQLAIERALAVANLTPDEIQLVEAHGTSTRVGDKVEVNVISEVYRNYLPPKSVWIGSVKSQIGHLKSAAGIASLIKIALSLYHKTLPPSINFENPNPNIDWDHSPFKVITEPKPWEIPEGSTRKAGVSAFGFGGTNFHAILEEFDPKRTRGRILVSYGNGAKNQDSYEESFRSRRTEVREGKEIDTELEGEVIFFGSRTLNGILPQLRDVERSIPEVSFFETGTGPRLRELSYGTTSSLSNEHRLGIVAKDFRGLLKQIQFARDVLRDPVKLKSAHLKGVFYGSGKMNGKVAFLFPGQGSQYVEMLGDLARKYRVVEDTLLEADRLLKELAGESLWDIIMGVNRSKEEASELLRQTQFTQPAMFTADIALYRLLKAFGLTPDMVAGHSLGEFAALVAAGVLSFEDGFKAVYARGRAMASVPNQDKGTMASINAPYKKIVEVLERTSEYVIPANKNSPEQTVIAGTTKGIQEALSLFREEKIQAVPLAVSAAFHTKLVEAAADELRRVLESLEFNPPNIPVFSNVTADYYPTMKEEIIELLYTQVSSPVEWTEEILMMYKSGARVFIEVGPKRALTTFTHAILKGKEYYAFFTNHPKKGGIQSLNEALAQAGVVGLPIKQPALLSHVYTSAFITPVTAKRTAFSLPHQSKQSVMNEARIKQSNVSLPQELRKYAKDYSELVQKALPALQVKDKIDRLGLSLEDAVVTGAAIGLPGLTRKVFEDTNFEDILAGKNFIDPIREDYKKRIVDKNIVRLNKGPDGNATFQVITDVSEVINFAAQLSEFNLYDEFGLAKDFIETYDNTTQLAIAAGLEALKDAGVPLVKTYVKTSIGTYLPGDWALPKDWQDDTGVVLASAFPGYNKLVEALSRYFAKKLHDTSRKEREHMFDLLMKKISDKKLRNELEAWFQKEFPVEDTEEVLYEFNRKFLFQVLSMGHSQFAQLIKARGPNIQINSACASTTQAIGIAEDWIRTNRCKRVIIVGADDVTSKHMLEWIGAGFLASGAATTKKKLEEAALPFDRRRNGMIIGAGAVGLILEKESEAEKRGIKPIARVMGCYYTNSAFHGSKLDVNHIAQELDKFISRVEKKYGISRREIASSLVFMSHETYTPARGGSAAAEIKALRYTFKDQANQIIIANTKGFTGHAMGAGLEDAVVIKAMQYGIIPPIANFKEPDPELGDLRLSRGGKQQVKYGLRLAAGFGSQLAFTLYKLEATKDRETPRYEKWLKKIGGNKSDLFIEQRVLKLRTKPPRKDYEKEGTKKPKEVTLLQQKERRITELKTPKIKSYSLSELTNELIELISEKTGYPTDMLDPELELEADLGIDTIKIAELFGIAREKYGLERDEGLRISDYPTIKAIASYLLERLGESSEGIQEETSSSLTEKETVVKQESTWMTNETIIHELIELISEKTGYPTDMLDPELELEADLGIDTIKIAELFGIAREKYGLERDEGLRISDYPTIKAIAQYLSNRLSGSNTITQKTGARKEKSKQQEPKDQVSSETDRNNRYEQIIKDLIELISEKTGYPTDMLDPELELEADLGIDTIKIAELFGIAREKYGLERDEGLRISDYPTIKAIATYLYEKQTGSLASLETKEEEIKSIDQEIQQSKKHKALPRNDALNSSEKYQEIMNYIVNLVAEKTGYPTDMLDPELELEADLGIDTIKIAELFGLVRERYGLERDEGLRISDYPTIKAITDYIFGRLESSLKVTIPVTQEKESKGNKDVNEELHASLSVDSRISKQEVLEIIAEITGFPSTLLDDNVNIQMDLGATRDVQLKVYQRLHEKYGIILPKNLESVDYGKIKRIIEVASQSNREKTVQTNVQEAFTSVKTLKEERTEDETRPSIRYVLGHRELPLSTEKLWEIQDKNVVIVSQTSKDASKLKGLFEKEKAHVQVITPRTMENNTVSSFLRTKIIDVIVFLEPQSRNLSYDTVKNFMGACFETVKRIKITRDTRFIAVVKTQSYGLLAQEKPEVVGLLTGFVKSVGMEYPENMSFAVAVTDEEKVIDELERKWDSAKEVFYKGKKRFIITVKPEALSTSTGRINLEKGDVILVTGGAQGITREIIHDLVKHNPVNVALIGRTKIPKDIEGLDKLDEKGLEARKEQIKAELKAKHGRVTPVMLNKEWLKIKKALNSYRFVKELQAMNVKAKYYSVDVTDKKGMKQVIKAIERDIGKITIIIHGAGIEHSKLITEKKLEEFLKIIDVKVLGFKNLEENLDFTRLKAVMSFSSVAGRFGNAGQTDYGAANDWLAKMSWWYSSTKKARVFVIDWSAWAGVGMATRGSIMKALKLAGVYPISITDGVRRAREELIYGNEAETVIAGPLGLLENPQKDTIINGRAMISTVTTTQNGNSLAKKELRIDEDLYLNDHRINGVAVLPGVMGLELLAEHALLERTGVIEEIKNIYFMRPIKLLRDNPRVVYSRRMGKHAFRLETSAIDRKGQVIYHNVHFLAEIHVSNALNKTSESLLLPREIKAAKTIPKNEIYTLFFHGPRFQVLKEAKIFSDKKAYASIQDLNKELFKTTTSKVVLNPLTIEVGFQLAGLWDLKVNNNMSLPYSIESIHFFKGGKPKHAISEFMEQHGPVKFYDIRILDEDQKVIMNMKRVGLVSTDLTKHEELPSLFNYEGKKLLIELFQIQGNGLRDSSDIIVKSLRVSDVIHEKEKYHSWLTEKERKHETEIRNEQRRNEWFAGVITVKQAILESKWFTGATQPTDIEVTYTKLGEPRLKIGSTNVLVSITHRNNIVVVVLARESLGIRAIGIDLEVIEHKTKAFLQEAFTPEEQKMLEWNGNTDFDSITAWTKKEVILKVLGKGLHESLSNASIMTEQHNEIIMLSRGILNHVLTIGLKKV